MQETVVIVTGVLLPSVTEYQMTGIIWIWNSNNLCSGKSIYRKNPPHGAECQGAKPYGAACGGIRNKYNKS